jgi:transcriptional regulator with XRE-family HTH domain
MSPKRQTEDPVRQEAERLMEMLRIFVRTLGYGNVEIARLSKIPHANVGRYFRGETRVPLDFVIAVVHALGLEFSEFFELAYADRRPAEPTVARQKIERILQALPARRETPAPLAPPPVGTAPPEQVTPLPRAEIEKMLEDLRRDVKTLLDARQTDKAVAPPPEPKAEPKPAKPSQKRKSES